MLNNRSTPNYENISSSEYEVIFFDVGNTLLYADPGIAESFVTTVNSMGYAVTLPDVLPHMNQVNAIYDDAYEQDGDFWCSHTRSVQLWLSMYVLLARLCGLGYRADEISKNMYSNYLNASYWSLYNDVLPALNALKTSGYRLGVVSNWDENLSGLIKGIGLGDYFDCVISSAAVGCRKPGKQIFDIALESMNTTPERSLHVGDLVEADGNGATRAGITPLILHRSASHSGSTDCPYASISSLTEIPVLLHN